MARTEPGAAFDELIALCACAVNGNAPDAARAAALDLPRLYEAAQRQHLGALAGYALEMAGVFDPVFVEAKARAMRKNVLLLRECEAVLRALDEAGIWHMPLKGAVMHSLYPDLGLREMTDIDILYDAARAREVRAIMERLGFDTELYVQSRYGDDHYTKAPLCFFEMHRALFVPRERRCFRYYRNVRERLIPEAGSACGLRFSDEDFYLYMIAHEYHHYIDGGTGLRALLDVWVYLRRYGDSLDWAYLRGELDKLGLRDFEARNRGLALHLFEGEALTEAEGEMLDYMHVSGAYGTRANRVKNELRELGGGRLARLRYVLHRIVLPVDTIRSKHPLFWRVPVLLPFLPLYRLGKSFFTNRATLKEELDQFRRSAKEPDQR